MKLTGLLYTLVVAAGTAGMLLAVMTPTDVTAVDGSATPAKIVQPALKFAHCIVTLSWDKEFYQPGEKPTLKLKARNTGDRPIDAPIALRMSSLSPTNSFSRMPARSMSLWNGECRIQLAPGETRTFAVAIDAALQPLAVPTLTASVKDVTGLNAAVPVKFDTAALQAKVAVNQVAVQKERPCPRA